MSAVTLFVLFNLIGVPLVGRLVWLGMGALHGGGSIAGAVALSVVAAFGVLGANVALTRRAAYQGVQKSGVVTMAVVSILTFGLTIGTGFFSPLNLVAALLRA